jgi:tetraacyldisaccharide 4'-kinase
VTELRVPAGAPPALLRPLARVYGLAVRLRNFRYDRYRPARPGIPVLSVGNLAVGGTGKTSLVEWIGRRLLSAGRRPAVVSRGYGGRAGRGPLVVSRGDGPRIPSSRCGDEPWLLASKLPGAWVVVGSNRTAAVAEAARGGCDVAVLDDGFQHRNIARDLDLVLLDAREPFGNGWLLPAGPLREPASGLARADAVLLTRWKDRGGGPDEAESIVRPYNAHCPVVRVRTIRTGFVDAMFGPAGRPERALAFCGIGNPRCFLEDLEEEGVRVLRFQVLPDHHRFDADELGLLYALARRKEAILVTTEKDLARMEASWRQAFGGDLRALRIEADPVEVDLLDRLIGAALAGTRP